MKKTLLLMAGSPGTGKSYFDNMIRQKISGFVELSIDVEKEFLYDKYGFDDVQQKEMLDYEALQLYLEKVRIEMEKGNSIISDYPFSVKQWGTLKRLSDEFEYQDISVVLTADIDALYARQLKRDLDPDRHIGHLMNHYHLGDKLEDRSKVDIHPTKEELQKFLESKKYDDFELGKVFRVDVSDFSKVDYTGIIDEISELVQGINSLGSYIDHTLLAPDSTTADIDKVIAEAKENEFYSVMVNPFWVEYVSEKLKDSDVKTATVIGFPLGANTTTVKEFELENAIQNGADELDMVINIGMFKEGNYTYVANEINRLARLAHGSQRILKVIIETSFLTDAEKAKAAQIVSESGADYVKTSTGFSSKGATVRDVKILSDNVSNGTLVKASGGIHSYSEAMDMIKSGASRLGTSQSVSIVDNK